MTTSPDPADDTTTYENWCEAHGLDPFDDDVREQFDIEMACFPDREEQPL